MIMKNRVIAALMAATMLAGSINFTIPMQVFAAGVSEAKYSDSLISGFHIQGKDKETNRLSASDSLGYKIKTDMGGSKCSTSNNNALYPLSYAKYKAANREDGSEWYKWAGWQMNSEESAFFAKLTKSAGNIQIGGKFEGRVDTQAGQNAGKPYFGIERKHNEGAKSTRIGYKEKKFSGKEKSLTNISYDVEWSDVESNINAIYVCMGSTKGTTGAFVKDRNYAELYNPMIFLRDQRNPTIENIEIIGGTDYNGQKNFVYGDELKVKATFSEPIRCKNNNYDASFVVSASGLDNFRAIEYDEVNGNKPYVVFSATVKDDENEQITPGSMHASVTPVNGAVTDLAGNVMDNIASSKNFANVVVSGFVPRIKSAAVTRAFIKDDIGKYRTVSALENKINKGDYLLFAITYNQPVRENNYGGATDFPVKVGNTDCRANAYTIKKNGSTIYEAKGYSSTPYSLADDKEFDYIEYILQIPEGAKDGDAVYIPAEHTSDGFWNITGTGAPFEAVQGNLIINDPSKRNYINHVSSIREPSSTSVLAPMVIDATPPILTLTDNRMQPLANVHTNAADANVDSEKPNKYKVYFKSNETVQGSVGAVLKYEPKDMPGEAVTVQEEMTGSYTTAVIDDMYAVFQLPYDIDSANYDIYIETTAYDFIFNKSIQKFYLEGDTRAPEVKISNGGGIGEKAEEESSQYWLWEFDVTDASTPQDMRLYYRFGNSGEFSFTDASTGFTVKSESAAVGTEQSGTIEYYAVDGNSNKSETQTASFYIGGKRQCSLRDGDDVSKYRPSRDVYFTGFEAPEETAGIGTVYDYLVYKINGGGYKYIKSNGGGDVYIPKEELANNDIITYKCLRNTETSIDAYLDEYAPMQIAVYHSDDAEPDARVTVVKDSVGATTGARIISPSDDHPRNIAAAKFTLSGQDGTVETDGSDYIKNGVLYANLDFEKILHDNNLPSGEYDLRVTVTDENGHIKEISDALGSDNKIIVDAPEMRNIKITSAHDDAFDENIGAFAHGDNTDNIIAVTDESVRELIDSGKDFTHKADEYKVEAQMYMPYAPKTTGGDPFDTGIVYYSISWDNGFSWAEYKEAEVTDAKNVTEDSGKYTVLDVCAPLPKNPMDKTMQYKVIFKCENNTKTSDVVWVETRTDTTQPDTFFAVTAVGDDTDGWSTNVDYTDKYVKYKCAGMDKGFLGMEIYSTITKLVDDDGNDVPVSGYSDYLETRQENGENFIIFKQRCHVYVEVSDYWGNTKYGDYECMYIADIQPEHRIYCNENTDGYTYLATLNVKDVKFAAVEKNSLEMTNEAEAKFSELVTDGVLIYEHLGLLSAVRAGEKNSVCRMKQNIIANSDYDIIAATYDTNGEEIETFKLMDILSSSPAPKVGKVSHYAENHGKSISVLESIDFDMPVSQIDPEIAPLLQDRVGESLPDLNTAGMLFDKTLLAVLNKDSEGDIYYVDEYKRLYHMNVSTEGTEFIDYDGFNITYTGVTDEGEISHDKDYIYGDNSKIKIRILPNGGVCSIKPYPHYFTDISDQSTPDTSGSEFDGYYEDLTLECSVSDIISFYGETEKLAAADITVMNKTNLEEYYDIVLAKTDGKAPVLLDKIEMLRTDKFSPQRIIYIFHDNRGIKEISCDSGEGYKERPSIHGISFVSITENGNYTVKAEDVNGNTTVLDDVVISDITKIDSLKKGEDYDIEVTDTDGNIVESGKYYNAVYVCPVPVEGGKPFTTSVTEPMLIKTETEVIFEFIDGEGKKVICRFEPPVDNTAPVVSAAQNNSGNIVSELRYSIYVADKRSGIKEVYIEDKNGQKIPLEAEDKGNLYSTYIYTSKTADDIMVVAVDNVGNESRKTLKSNSQVIGDLSVETVKSTEGFTKKNVAVTFRAEDGRRIYTHVLDDAEGDYLLPSEYMVSGNTIIFTKNGSVLAECTDEAGNRVSKIVTITNIDKEPPVVTANVSSIKRADGSTDPAKARVTFKADGADDAPMRVHLLYWEKQEGEDISEKIDKFKQQWQEYMKSPESYVMSDEFEETFEHIYKLDITDKTTHVDVDSNGEHTFYLFDNAGNIAKSVANVTIIDDKKPEFNAIGYSFLASEFFGNAQEIKGQAKQDAEKVSITEPATNQNVTVEVTSNEPVRIFGSGTEEFSANQTYTFNSNGTYNFIIEDEAGNTNEKTVSVSNITKDEMFIEYDGGEIVLFEGKTDGFKVDDISRIKVYKYDKDGKKQYLEQGKDCEVRIDYGGLNVTDINANTFDRTNPYVVTYEAADKAGNKATRTRNVILASASDTIVTVNGDLPNSASCIYTTGDKLNIKIANYTGKSVVKVLDGQLNAAKMKQKKGIETAVGNNDIYEFTPLGTGWYTIGVRTLFQDVFTVWVYVD